MKMREILFRGKRVDTGEWVEGFLSRGRYYGYKENSLQTAIDREEKGVMCTSVVKPETVGQYTGLTDINGTKIFEGDIVSSSMFDFAVIEWDEEDAMFLCVYDETNTCNFGEIWGRELEVISNIYDNEDLLYEAECLKDAKEVKNG